MILLGPGAREIYWYFDNTFALTIIVYNTFTLGLSNKYSCFSHLYVAEPTQWMSLYEHNQEVSVE